MARTKKVEQPALEAGLTKQEVIDVLEFGRALAGAYYPQLLSPDMVSQRLKETSYSPLAPTETTLNNALKDPKSSESDLRSFVEYYELISAPFRRIISYLTSQLSLDLNYTV